MSLNNYDNNDENKKIDYKKLNRRIPYIINADNTPSIGQGPACKRPLPGVMGRLFLDITNNILYRDNGRQWEQVGIQGPKGDKGDQGPEGIQGLKGDKGDQGPEGKQGLKGDKGDQGPQGIQGLKGDKGDQGPQGIQGLKGDKGDQGPQGNPGLSSPGHNTQSIGLYSLAEGESTTAKGDYSHAEGWFSNAKGKASHAEGSGTTAENDFSHAEGSGNEANGYGSHAEGVGTQANGKASHAEGGDPGPCYGSLLTKANGDFSHAEGAGTQANGDYSHSEGYITKANDLASHAEGYLTKANGWFCHAEGFRTKAKGVASHAEGGYAQANIDYSHAEGAETQANGFISHAEGFYTQTNGEGCHIMGKYGASPMNNTDPNYSWYLANGTDENNPGLAAKILNNGNAYADGSWYSGGADYAEMFETVDGNTIKPGYFIALEKDKIRKANSTDTFILGITSASPAFVGDTGELRWKNKFVTDEWGEVQYHDVTVPEVKDTDGNIIIPSRTESQPILNPLYDNTKEYISRKRRDEWVSVGLIGKLLLRDDGTCPPNGYCKPTDEGIATTSTTGYRVLKRTGPNQILVLFK